MNTRNSSLMPFHNEDGQIRVLTADQGACLALKHKPRDEWEWTTPEQPWAKARSCCGHGQSGYQILSNPAGVGTLRELAPWRTLAPAARQPTRIPSCRQGRLQVEPLSMARG
jgi:hypothetical protein